MHYSQDVEKASQIAAQAFERIAKESLPPTPENYELWYVYYAKLDPELNHAIDVLVSSDQGITNDRCLELYKKHLSEFSRNERVQKAGDKIQQTIQNVGGAVETVKDATSKYNQSLEGVNSKLHPDMSAEEMQAVVQNAVAETQAMIEENQRLEVELSQSSEIMHELKSDLEIMRQQARTDGLTSLLNRKSLDLELERVVREAEETGESFCFIMMDIDHFKKFNDDYGHQVGDQVLRLVARTLFDGVKGRDIVARYGGEEFAIILPDTTLEHGEKLANALRMAVANKEVVNRNSGTKLGRITLSGGVAEFEAKEDIECLIARADNALYAAKHKGRNKVVPADSSSHQGDAQEKEAG